MRVQSQPHVNLLAPPDRSDTKQGHCKRTCEGQGYVFLSKRTKANPDSKGHTDRVPAIPTVKKEEVEAELCCKGPFPVAHPLTCQNAFVEPADGAAGGAPVPVRRAGDCGRIPGLRTAGFLGTGLLGGRADAGSAGCRKALELGLGLSLGLPPRSSTRAVSASANGRTHGAKPLVANLSAARPSFLAPTKPAGGAASVTSIHAGPWLTADGAVGPGLRAAAPVSAPAAGATAPTKAAAPLHSLAAPISRLANQLPPGRVNTRLRRLEGLVGPPCARPGPAARPVAQRLGSRAYAAYGSAGGEAALHADAGRYGGGCAGNVSGSETETGNGMDHGDESDGDTASSETDGGRSSSCGPDSGSGPASDGSDNASASTDGATAESDGDSDTEDPMAVDSQSGKETVQRSRQSPVPAIPGGSGSPAPAAAVATVSAPAAVPTLPVPARVPAPVPMLDGTVRVALGARDPYGPPWLLLPRSDRCLRFSKRAAVAIWPQLMTGNTSGRMPVKAYLLEPVRASAQASDGAAAAVDSTLTPLHLYMRLGANGRMSLRGFPRWPLVPGLHWEAPLQLSASPTGDGALIELPDEATLERHRLRVPRVAALGCSALPSLGPAAVTRAGLDADGGGGGTVAASGAVRCVASSCDGTGAGGGGNSRSYGAGRGGIVGGGDACDLVLRVRLSARSFNPNAYMILPGAAAQHFFLHLMRPASAGVAAAPPAGCAAAAGGGAVDGRGSGDAAAGPGDRGGRPRAPLQEQQQQQAPSGGRVDTGACGVTGAAATGADDAVPGDAVPRRPGAAGEAAAGAGAVGRARAGSDAGLVRPSVPAQPPRNCSHGITLIPEAWPDMRFQAILRYRFPALLDLPSSVCLPRASVGPGAVTPLVLYGAVPGDVMELWQRPGGTAGEYLCRVIRADGRGVRGPPVKRGAEGERTAADGAV